ncbi:hypothetical protein SAMN04487911_102163 [Arenibacter nanhaiticus]|uniref:N-terminal domain of galactosyltransferase n=1 Tax=Arenibacter nanhaiticus TaxID=558155 RepID=A0A1M6BEA5_9FLAO|nr:glycosyltransferase family 2 protein [Arenibacter nanhaiticus]SHI47016.1 hypothetical protein SAMN04487911_102163 [Arenibacter nanhaiticus]
MKPKATLLISTYNWPSALKKVLESILYQSVKPSQIIIADDGSKKETKGLIALFQKQHPSLNLLHLWQQDQGFRKTIILNKAITRATTPYIIQIDGDCIMHSKFIEDHIAYAEKGFFVCGRRVMLKESFSKSILKDRLNFRNPFVKLLALKFNFKYQFQLPLMAKKKLKIISEQNQHQAFGCNLAYWKNDILTINGYSEDFIGWGPEDSELTNRLLNSQKKAKQIFYSGIVYHIYHKEISREYTPRNIELYKASLNKNLIVTPNGIIKH